VREVSWISVCHCMKVNRRKGADAFEYDLGGCHLTGLIFTPSFYQMNKPIRKLEEQVRYLTDERRGHL